MINGCGCILFFCNQGRTGELRRPWGQLNLLMATLVVVYSLWDVTAYLWTYLAQLVGHRVILDLRPIYTSTSRGFPIRFSV
ncbi:MAG: hypothetical protein KY445_07570 [Armatimonadetes bacterium]|nr:hypothetical protein [Armatimonadota bacterium]